MNQGTRSKTGKLRDFKAGAFEIALATKRWGHWHAHVQTRTRRSFHGKILSLAAASHVIVTLFLSLSLSLVLFLSRRPILPIVITGTNEALPADGFMICPSAGIELRVMPPIDPSKFEGQGVQELTDMVRGMFVEELEGGRDAATTN
jgi:1-acyl-sn-glycerol-3-phosphate acyltransferase